ncbi:hypothetical protein [Cytobacillus firmus]|uniref:hypothetical protein n=1 Tax=Cytobacillus firmus TaxID=1399 RepID=UPI001C8E3237|nr:hypothetical protein [Cytobacillus firmus]MBX9972535.1 hypothetical protein [Cytobacillus firmus]
MKDEEKKGMIQNLEAIWKDDTSAKLFANSISSIHPSGKRLLFLLILLGVTFLSYDKFFNKNIHAIESTLLITNSINAVLVPIFAVLITGYAIFQALANGRTLVALIKASDKEKSKFQRYNYFFFSITTLFLFIIVLNFILSVFLNNVPNTWHLPYFTIENNNRIFSFLISVYLTFVINALIEVKSFIYNLYQVFSAHATASAIDYLDKEK